MAAMTPEMMAQSKQVFDNHHNRSEASHHKSNAELKETFTSSIKDIANKVEDIGAKVDAQEAKRVAEMSSLRPEMQAEFMAKFEEINSKMAAMKTELKDDLKSEVR